MKRSSARISPVWRTARSGDVIRNLSISIERPHRIAADMVDPGQ